jgi:GT2 family glycosyltransferase
LTAYSEPTFSIIVPTRGRPVQLAACLDALRRLDFPSDQFETIVVDDGSPVPLDDVVRPFGSSNRIVLLRTPHGGPAAARNIGAKAARGRFIAFTDDDCRVANAWLKALGARLERDSNQMVGGAVVNSLVDNPFAITSQVILDSVYSYYNRSPESASFFASNNMAMPTALFHRVGGFDASFPRAAAEDRDFCDRWRHAGQKMTFAQEAVVYHGHDLRFRSFVRQHFNYGCGAWQYHVRRGRRKSGRLRSDLSFHGKLPQLLLPSWSKLHPRQKVVVGGLLAVWQAANTAGFFWQALRSLKSMRRFRADLHPGKRLKSESAGASNGASGTSQFDSHSPERIHAPASTPKIYRSATDPISNSPVCPCAENPRDR